MKILPVGRGVYMLKDRQRETDRHIWRS